MVWTPIPTGNRTATDQGGLARVVPHPAHDPVSIESLFRSEIDVSEPYDRATIVPH
jgi:hypothetical protein